MSVQIWIQPKIILDFISHSIGTEIWKGDEHREFKFLEPGGSLNGRKETSSLNCLPVAFLTKAFLFTECLAAIQWKGASLHWFLLRRIPFPKPRQEKRAQRSTFGVWRPPGGVGGFHAKGWGSKSSCLPSKVCLPWVSKRGTWDVSGILPRCPRTTLYLFHAPTCICLSLPPSNCRNIPYWGIFWAIEGLHLWGVY